MNRQAAIGGLRRWPTPSHQAAKVFMVLPILWALLMRIRRRLFDLPIEL